jgi:hypothetical protein
MVGRRLFCIGVIARSSMKAAEALWQQLGPSGFAAKSFAWTIYDTKGRQHVA